MRSIQRPLVATGTAVLLAISFAACGDDGDGKAGDDASSEATETESGEPSASTGATDDASGATDGSEATEGATTGGADAAGAATTEQFCAGILDVVKVTAPVATSRPSEAEWAKIRKAYADLGEIGAPADIPADEKEGFEITIEAISSLSYAEAEKALAEAKGIPGVSAEDNAKAEAFYRWAGTACPELSGSGGSGGAPAE